MATLFPARTDDPSFYINPEAIAKVTYRKVEGDAHGDSHRVVCLHFNDGLPTIEIPESKLTPVLHRILHRLQE